VGSDPAPRPPEADGRPDPLPIPEPAPTRTSPGAWGVMLGTLVFGLITDLGSKWAAFRYIADTPAVVRRAEVLEADRLGVLLPSHDPVTVIPSVLDLTLVLNPGAVFGIGAGQRWLFVTFTAFAVLFAVHVFLHWTRPRDRLAHLAIGLLLSGGLGNLYDRLRFACVRDFIHPLPGVRLPFGLRWPNGSEEIWPYVSNVADLWLIIGIGMLLVMCWRIPADHKHGDPKPADTPGG
jgi:signal peptidase II